jgi:alpha-L-fucosidase 2
MDIIQDSFYVEIQNNRFKLSGFINGNNRPFCVMFDLQNDGGELVQTKNSLGVKNANSAIIYLTMATNYKMKYPDYKGGDPVKIANTILEKVSNISYEQLKEHHISDYHALYNRSSFKLNANGEAERLPTNERFQKLRKGGSDPGYKELAFNLGKYLITQVSEKSPSNSVIAT